MATVRKLSSLLDVGGWKSNVFLITLRIAVPSVLSALIMCSLYWSGQIKMILMEKLTGFEMRTTVSVAVPTSRQPLPDSSNASLPAPDPPSQPKRKPKSRRLGFCKCSSRGSCSAGYCVCYADRVVCNPQCTCQPYCQNKGNVCSQPFI